MKLVANKGLSLRTRITLYAMMLTVAALALIAVLSYGLFCSQLKQSIVKHQAAQIDLLAFQVDDRLKLVLDQLQRIADTIGPNELSDPDRLQRILDSKDEPRTFYNNGFLVIDANTRLVVDSPFVANRRGTDYSFRDYAIQTLKTGTHYITDPYRPVIPPYNPSITLTAPIKGSDGKVIGLLAGRHNLFKSSFLESIGKTTVSDVGYLYIITANRTLIVHPDKNRIMEKIKPGVNVGIDRAIQEGFEGSLENINSKGLPGITSFKHLKNADWIIASHVPLSTIYRPLRVTELTVFVAFLGIALVSALLIWRVLGKIMMPLQQVINHIGSISTKQAKERFLPDAFDGELGQLGRVFNTMLEEFDDNQETLRASQETYRIVAEFTAEVAFWHKPGGLMVFISPNCLELSGYSDSEYYADPDLLNRIIHPDFRAMWEGHTHQQEEENGALQQIDLKIVRKDGEERWVTHLCHHVFNEQGRQLGVRGNFTDVTLIRQIQAELREQRAFAEGVINKAAVPIFVLGVNHCIIVWNNAMEDLTGLRAEEMLGTKRQWEPFYENERPVLADIVLSEDKKHLDELYDTYSMSKHVVGGLQAEGWYENVGGQRRYLFFDAALIVGANGVKLGAIETLLDITERKQAEVEQRKLSRAVSENPCSIIITNSEGTIEYVNQKFCDLTGYTTDDVVGQNLHMQTFAEMASEHYFELWNEISHGKTWHDELSNRKKSGELYWEIVSISPIKDEEGSITHYLVIKEDITQRKTNEVELEDSKDEIQEQQKQLEKVFKIMETAKREWEETLDCISDMVLMCDTFGKIKRCNRPIIELTGLPFEDIQGKNWMTLMAGNGIQVIDFNGQQGHLFDPNSQRHFEMNVYPIKQPGNPLQSGTVVSIHDMTIMKAMNSKLEEAYTELKQTQSQIVQQEKMASIGQLAAGVAHEINNPMGFISSNLGSLGKYMEKFCTYNAALQEAVQSKGDLDTIAALNELRQKMKIDFMLGDITELLAESHDGAERVRQIVKDLKSFSHVDETQCKPFSINECLDSTLNMARNEIKYVADVTLDYDNDLPLLNGYPQQLNQVFMNILVNAAHAIEGRGGISVQTRLEDDNIVVRLSDTGIGIAPENLTRIFEPFFTTKEIGKGTGLGLSISYDIIKKHGGNIFVESEVGVGTTFTIQLPMNHKIAENQVAS